MKNVLLLFTMLFICFAAPSNAQEEKTDRETVSLPDHIMKYVVERVVIEHFSASRRKGEILFSEQNIKREWLPKMKRIEFVFVTEADEDDEVHFFKEPTRSGDLYEIDFGWGDPGCSAMGETYQFKLVNGQVQGFTRSSGGWGMGCSSAVSANKLLISVSLSERSDLFEIYNRDPNFRLQKL